MTRFARRPLAVLGLALALVLVGASILAPALAGRSPSATDAAHVLRPPSRDHWLGTDSLGRDVWARLLHGGRVSLLVGVAAVLIQAAIGTALGALSGYCGGPVDMAVQRLVDVMLAFPALMFLLVLVSVLGPGMVSLFIAVGLLNWAGMCRLVRGQVLQVREQDYILAARAVGCTGLRIVLRHILPNVAGIILVTMVTSLGGALMLEAGLSYLGLGVQPPAPSWGNMLSVSLLNLGQRPWLWLPSGVCLVAAALAFNFVGEGLREVMGGR